MRNPYDILGVPKSATEADIKKAYRRLAKLHHPDQAKDDPKAKDRFAEIGSAYEILGDTDKRRQFDAGEIDAEGKPRFQGFAGQGAGAGRGGFEGFPFGFGQGGGFRQQRGGFDPSDIFADIMGNGARRQQRGPVPGQDIEAEILIGLEEAVRGGTRRVTLPDGRSIDVAIPAGVAHGKTIRLKGQGHPSMMGGPPGDLRLLVAYAKHPRFAVEGPTVRLRQPVSLRDAVLGGPIRVETLDGAVELTLPPMTSSGKAFRLKGKGLPHDKTRGDMIVSVEIVLPEGDDPELAALMRGRER